MRLKDWLPIGISVIALAVSIVPLYKDNFTEDHNVVAVFRIRNADFGPTAGTIGFSEQEPLQLQVVFMNQGDRTEVILSAQLWVGDLEGHDAFVSGVTECNAKHACKDDPIILKAGESASRTLSVSGPTVSAELSTKGRTYLILATEPLGRGGLPKPDSRKLYLLEPPNKTNSTPTFFIDPPLIHNFYPLIHYREWL